jgi:hypothetical protein
MIIWPQTVYALFIAYLIHQQYKQYQKRKTPFSKTRFKNAIIGIVALTALLYFGGFFNALW